MKRRSSGSRASSAEQPVKKNPRVVLVPRSDCKQQVAHIDYRNSSGTQKECLQDVFMAAKDAAEIGCSAICVSLEPTMESFGELCDERDPWELNEKPFNCRVSAHVVLLYDPDVLRLVACESLDPDNCMPALCATLEVKGAVSSAAQPAPHILFLVGCSLRNNAPRGVKVRMIGTYLLRCAQFAGEHENNTKTSIVIGGNFGGLDGVRISALVQTHRVLHRELYAVSECDSLYVLCSAEGAPEPCMKHCRGNVRALVSIFPVARPILPPTQAALAASPSHYADNHHPLHHHSAAQPVLPPTQAALAPPPPHLVLVDNTPLFNEFLLTITNADDADELLQHIERFCFSSDLCFVKQDGERLLTPMPLARTLEDLFSIALQRRGIMARESGWRRSDFKTRCATEEEMKTMINAWRKDVDSWMNPKTLDQYHKKKTQQEKHLLSKSRFSTYQFHIAGCKFLLSKFIEYPIIAQLETPLSGLGSAAQPAETVRRLLDSYEKHKKTDAYKTAVEASERKSKDRMRLSQQIWRIACEVGQGNRIRRKLENGNINDDDLDGAQQELINRLEENEDELQKLRKQHLPVYRGAWAHVQC